MLLVIFIGPVLCVIQADIRKPFSNNIPVDVHIDYACVILEIQASAAGFHISFNLDVYLCLVDDWIPIVIIFMIEKRSVLKEYTCSIIGCKTFFGFADRNITVHCDRLFGIVFGLCKNAVSFSDFLGRIGIRCYGTIDRYCGISLKIINGRQTVSFTFYFPRFNGNC